MTSRALTLSQAAKVLGCDKRTIARAVASGEISATRRDDGTYTIDASELERRRADWDLPARDRRRRSDREAGGNVLKV
jgi:excisionase family DNA binding protein